MRLLVSQHQRGRVLGLAFLQRIEASDRAIHLGGRQASQIAGKVDQGPAQLGVELALVHLLGHRLGIGHHAHPGWALIVLRVIGQTRQRLSGFAKLASDHHQPEQEGELLTQLLAWRLLSVVAPA